MKTIIKFLLAVMLIVAANKAHAQWVGLYPQVTTYTVTGGGNYCAGLTGLPVGLANSQNSIQYYLYYNGSNTGISSGGSGYPINFGNQVNPGTYTVMSFNPSDGCYLPMAGSVTIGIIPLPSDTIIVTGSPNVCFPNTVPLTASTNASPATYQWQLNGSTITGATNANYTATQTGLYTCKVTNSSGCFNMANQNVNIYALPTPTATASPTDICPGGSALLTAGGGVSYLWNTGATTASTSVTPATTSNYTVTVTNNNGCTAIAMTTVAVDPVPGVAINPSASSICPLGSVTLNASGGVSYLWNTGVTTTAITVSPNVTTIYTVTATNSFGCTAATTATVTVNPVPNPLVTPPSVAICSGQTTSFTASGGTSYLWNNGSGNATINVAPPVTTTYTVTVTNNFGCTNSATAVVNVNPLPTAIITPAAPSICPGSSVNITASGGASYLWSTGATTAMINVSPLTTTTYSVTVTSLFGCASVTSATVTVNPIPGVAINPSAISICPLGSVTLNASGGISYLWNTGVTTTAITVTPAVTTTYTVTATNSFGCTASTTATITVNPVPNANVTPSNATICNGQSVSFTASGGVNYAWSTGAGTPTINVSPNVTTTYTVTVTNNFGCTNSATAVVNVNPLPTAIITPNTPSICPGGSVNITASGGATYLWSTGATTATISVAPIATTMYSVTVTSGFGCVSVTSVIVTVNPVPGIAINPSSSTICPLGSVVLTAGGGITYLWNTGATTPTTTVTPFVTTTYTVTATNSFGCTATTTAMVTVNPVPTPSVTPPSATICNGQSASFTASGGVNYAWSNGSGNATINVSPNVTTVYTVTVSNNFGCTNSATAVVNVNPLPVISITPATTICDGQNTILTASGGATYLWSTGVTTSSITVSPNTATMYIVTVTSGTGCSAIASTMVNVNPLPATATAISGPTIICQNLTAWFTTNSILNATTYVWSVPTGATIVSGLGTTQIQVDFAGASSGTIYVHGTNACGDGQSSLLSITVNTAPTLTVTANPATLCAGTSTTLTANGNGTSFLWNTGITTQVLTTPILTTTVTYYVTVTGANTCSATGNVTVTVNPLPAVSLTLTPDHYCTGINTATLSGGLPLGGTWSGPALFDQTGTIHPPITGHGTSTVTYTVISNGCSNSATDLLGIYDPPAVSFTNITVPIYTDTPPFDLMFNVSPTGGTFTGWGIVGTTSTFDPGTGSGLHTITYTYTDPFSGCSTTQIQYFPVGAVGLEEFISMVNTITIFPNPVSTNLHLNGFNTKDITTLKIMNLIGEVIYTTKTNTENMMINVSDYSSGTYIISFVNTDGLSISKYFIKE